jgi:RNA polymerase sigma factor (sigma-70 family)
MADSELSAVVRHLRKLEEKDNACRLHDQQLVDRFAAHRDERAFETLVARHGPMVWNVCRRVLHDASEIEDAFQATFLVLVQKAGSIQEGELLGNWLYGVAYRTAARAKVEAAKRRARERAAPARRPADPLDEISVRELLSALDRELYDLPSQYRAPLVLCYLESKTRDEAARQLECSLATLDRRLGRGRELLRRRLARSGLTLSMALPAMLVRDATASVSRALIHSTVQTAQASAAGGSAAGVISTRVAALAQGVSKAMFVTKLRSLAVLLLALGVAAAGGGVLAYRRPAQPAALGQTDSPKTKDKKNDSSKAAAEQQARTDRHGDPLPAEAVARLGTLRFRQGSHITWLAFTPDGKQLVSLGWDGVRVWDAVSGREVVQTTSEADSSISGAFLTPDGKTLVTMERGRKGNLIRLRNRSDLKVVREFAVGWLQTARLSSDGKLLAGLADNNSTIEIWDVGSGKRRRSWKAHEGWIWCCAFSADSKTLVSGGSDKAIRFWDVATGRKEREITGHPNIVGQLSLSADGALLASLGMIEVKAGAGSYFPLDNVIRIWDVTTGKELHQLTMPAQQGFRNRLAGFGYLTFAADGKTLVTTGQDGLLRLWDAAAGKELRRFSLGTKGASRPALSPDGKTLAVGTIAIRLIDVASGADVQPPGEHIHGVFATPTTDGKTVITADGDGIVVNWDVAAARPRRRLAGSAKRISTVHVVGDDRQLLSIGEDNVVRLWDLATGEERRRFQLPAAGFGRPAVSRDSRILAVPGKDRTVLLIDVATGNEVGKLEGHDEWVSGVAFSPDGLSLISWCNDHTAHVWDVKTRRKRHQFSFADVRPNRSDGRPVPAPVGPGGTRTGLGYAAAASPDGQLVAYGSQSHYLALHETATGKAVRVLTDLPDGASALAFSPDSRMLAWGGWRDPTIHLVEVASGRERHQLTGHKGRVYSLAFSGDGRLLVSGNEDTTALVWDLTGKGKGPLRRPELVSYWDDLAGEDAARAYQAMRRLATSAVEAVSCFQQRLLPTAPVDAKRLAHLIADLDSGQFAVRQGAARELEKLGEAAVPACRKALEDNPSAELRRRLEPLLEKQAREVWDPGPDHLRALRAVEVLERMATPEARRLLAGLAHGALEARLTQEAKASLERLARRPPATP